LVNKLELGGFTADDLTKLGQYKDLLGVRDVVRGLSEIVPITFILVRKRFDPTTFISEHWSIAEFLGRRRGGNLDARQIVQKTYLRDGESFTTGEERLRRIKATPDDIQLDGEDFLALYKEEGQLTLRWLYETQGIRRLSFWGTILRSPSGGRVVLYLYRSDDGSWNWSCRWVGNDHWSASYPAAVLVSLPAKASA